MLAIGRYPLTLDQLTTIRAALRFSLDFKDNYYTLAPEKGDYNSGDDLLQEDRERIAQNLLDKILN